MAIAVLVIGLLLAHAHAVTRLSEVTVTSEDEWLQALANPNVSVIFLGSDLSISSSAQVPGEDPVTGVYTLTRNVTISGPQNAPEWYPLMDFTLVMTPHLRIPAGITLLLKDILLGHMGPQGSLTSGTVGYDVPFFDPLSSGDIVRKDCFLVLPACSPMDMVGYILSFVPRPAVIGGSQRSANLTKGACVPTDPSRIVTGKCFSSAFLLVDAVWQKVIIGSTTLYSRPLGNYIDYFVNVTVLCDQVFSKECVQKFGLYNCSKMLTGNATLVAPSVPALATAAPVNATPGAQGEEDGQGMSTGVVIGVAVGAGIGGLVLLLAAVYVTYQMTRRHAIPARSKLNQMYDHPTLECNDSQALDDRTPSCEAASHKEDDRFDFLAEAFSASDSTPPILLPAPPVLLQEGTDTPLEKPSPPSEADIIFELSKMSHLVETSISDNQLIIKDVIGSGAYGTVYSGLWKGLPVAIKSLLFTTDGNGSGGEVPKKDRILMEAALSKSISHPNVVTSYCCDLKPFSVDGDSVAGSSGVLVTAEAHVLKHWRIYIIQELCDGGSLRKAIESRSLVGGFGTFPEIPMSNLLDLAVGLSSGMAHLHERNIIHGDLNPANVLLKWSSNGRPIPKVCDFGLSVHLTASKSHVSNSRRGTPFYIAPEVAHHGNLSKAADVFAMGIMLWELYMCKIVWMISHAGQIVQRNTFPRLPRGTPSKYQNLMMACLNKDPLRRPTFSAIVDSLQGLRRELVSDSATVSMVMVSHSEGRQLMGHFDMSPVGIKPQPQPQLEIVMGSSDRAVGPGTGANLNSHHLQPAGPALLGTSHANTDA